MQSHRRKRILTASCARTDVHALEVARALAPETSVGKQIPGILKGLKAQAAKQAGENAPKPKKTEKSE